MRRLSTLLRIIDVVSDWAGKVASFLVILIIGTLIWITIARYVFKTTTVWTYATATKILFVYIIFGAAYVFHARAHVNMDILYSRFSLRVRSIVDAITFIAFFSFCFVLLWMAVKTAAMEALRFHFSLRSFLPPYWPVTLVAPFGIFLLLLQGLAKFVRDIIIAVTGKELP